MISVLDLWNAELEYSKKNQSGSDSVDAWNLRLKQVQIAFLNILAPLCETNQVAVNLLQPVIVESDTIISSAAGVLTKPSNCIYPLSYSLVTNDGQFEVRYLRYNQLQTYKKLTQRRPDSSKNRVYITMLNNNLRCSPEEALSFKMIYVKEAPEAVIAFTEDDSGDEDKLVYDSNNSVDLVWDSSCYNIILYMMLERKGVSMREPLLNEFAQLGLNVELMNIKSN